MNFSITRGLLAATTLVAFVLVGCAMPPTQTMVETDLVGDRTVQYLLSAPGFEGDAGMGEADAEYNFQIRVCDIGADQRAANCADTTVLEQVGFNPDPDDTAEIDAKREVSTVFWYNPEILYVAYIERPDLDVAGELTGIDNFQPKVKMCRVEQGNTLRCSDQPGINEHLEITEEL